jgi:ABC-type transporter Mla MlaB component
MKISISGTGVHLEGDWTLAGVTQSAIESLAVALQQLEAVGARRLDVDCRYVKAFDTTGQQILNVWLQCSRLRGVEPEVVNFPKNLQKIFKAYSPSSSDTAGPSTLAQGKAGRRTWTPTAITASPMRSVVNR